MRCRRGLLPLLAVGALLAIGPPASAHQRATLTIDSPREASTVGAGRVDVVIVATGGALASVDFAVRLDGQSVDVTGDLASGSVFTAHSLRAGGRVHLRVPVPGDGEHELRLVYAPDPHDPRPDVVRRFSTDESIETVVLDGHGVLVPWSVVIGLAVVVVGTTVVVRRRRMRGR